MIEARAALGPENGQRLDAMPEAGATDVATCARGTVVVADDDTATRMMLGQILRRQHYRVIEVENGRLACEAVRREHPDVVLLDWSMPIMDGLTALKVLKSADETRGIPVVMLTTQSQVEEKVLAIEAGAQDFLIKPCHPRELVARIDQQRRWRAVVATEVSAVAVTQAEAVERSRVASQIESLKESAMRDALTGLLNRVLLNDRVDQAILSSNRCKERFALLFLDLDGFKEINDGHGHATGDSVLRIVATRLSKAIRESDTVARIGGDEFVVLAPRILKPQNARELAARLVDVLATPMKVGQKTLAVSTSVGVALFPFDALERDALLRSADAAMYVSKRAGKNRYSFGNEDVFSNAELWEA